MNFLQFLKGFLVLSNYFVIIVRIRLEHQIREIEYEKKKLIGDFEEKIELLTSEKRDKEKSVAELREELEARDQV